MKIYNRYEILKGQTGPEHGREDLLTRSVKEYPLQEPRGRYDSLPAAPLILLLGDSGWFD
jgi:hypothetical protein